MADEYRQGDEFRIGAQGAGARRFKLEGKRQGREAFRGPETVERSLSEQQERGDGFKDFVQILIYQAAADCLLQQLGEAELAAAEALETAQKRERQAQQEIERIRKAATQAGDGRTVYLTADGAHRPSMSGATP